ncbi:MAG: fatty acid desaturase, partial [Bdellovibrionota bacterium]
MRTNFKKQPFDVHVPKRLPALVEGSIDITLFLVFLSLCYVSSVVDNMFFAVPAAILNGFISIQVILMFHDCMHDSAFSNPKVNAFVGRFVGAFAAFPFNFIKASHTQHHRRAGLIDGDTELIDPAVDQISKIRFSPALARLGRTPLGPPFYFAILHMIHFAEWIVSRQPTILKSKTLLKAVAIDILLIVAVRLSIHYFLMSQGKVLQGYLLGYILPYLIGMSITAFASKPLHTLTAA